MGQSLVEVGRTDKGDLGTQENNVTPIFYQKCVLAVPWPPELITAILGSVPQLVSEASQKRLSILLNGEYAPSLLLMEATSSCAEQIKSGHKNRIENPVPLPVPGKIKGLGWHKENTTLETNSGNYKH